MGRVCIYMYMMWKKQLAKIVTTTPASLSHLRWLGGYMLFWSSSVIASLSILRATKYLSH